MTDPYTQALAMIEELRAERDVLAAKHARLVEQRKRVYDLHQCHGGDCVVCELRNEPETPRGEEK